MISKLLLFFVCFCTSIYASWAEERLEKMTLEEKIGQLFVAPACPLRDERHFENLARVFEKFHVGGIIPKQGTVAAHIALVNRLQEHSKYPLLCVADAEWGLSMRLQDTMRFPKNLTLGAIQEMRLLYELGNVIGEQCKQVGIQINLAPVVDVNSNPKNRIIHMRSFGEDPKEVAKRGVAFMQGMQATGTLACAKHFIGHGDTTIDSHDDLPIVPYSLKRLEKIELFPFQRMIDAKVACIMTGHLAVPALEKNPELPASLSYSITSSLLKKKMGFQGLVITDALNMQALTRHFSFEEIALLAFLAGNDLLLYGDHIAPNVDAILNEQIPRAFSALKKACQEGKISMSELDARILKILKCKEALHLHQERKVSSNAQVDTPERAALKRELYRAAITVVENKGALLPFATSRKVTLLQNLNDPVFKRALESYSGAEEPELKIVALYGNTLDAKTIEEFVVKAKPDVLILFGTPYNLELLPACPAIIVAYEQDPDASQAVADILFGKLTPKGKLPVSGSPSYPVGIGLTWE